LGADILTPKDHTGLKIAALSAVLALGAFWGVQANWPEARIGISILSPLTFDDPEPTFRRAMGVDADIGPERIASRPPASRRNTFELIPPASDASLPQGLESAAESGDVSAQLSMAHILEQGRGGVRRNPVAARRWMRRAAGSGNAAAMHNLGLYLLEGTGGGRDAREAGAWFRRAAERGVVDAQFNLAVLAMADDDTSTGLHTAYFWFAVASRGGDLGARAWVSRLAPRVSEAERGRLDHAALAFHPLSDVTLSDEDLIIAPAGNLLETQRLLARKGYYVGELDGHPNLAFLRAATAYLTAHPQTQRAIDLPR
jgi:localization factor PodJL